MHYIVALGNPGTSYAMTRHNIGWRVASELITRDGFSAPQVSLRRRGLLSTGAIAAHQVTVLYPTMFMNMSGVVVAAAVPKDARRRMVVVHDEVALPFGSVRISVGSGAAGHNGVQSIIDTCATKDFIRVRLGVGAPPLAVTLERFVLEPFTHMEELAIPGMIERALAALESIIVNGAEIAMNTYNTNTSTVEKTSEPK